MLGGAGSCHSLRCKTLQAPGKMPWCVRLISLIYIGFLLRQVRPGQTSDPTSGFATATGYQSAAGAASVAPTPSLTPMLGGGRTPLVGDAKVHNRARQGNPAATQMAHMTCASHDPVSGWQLQAPRCDR